MFVSRQSDSLGLFLPGALCSVTRMCGESDLEAHGRSGETVGSPHGGFLENGRSAQ